MYTNTHVYFVQEKLKALPSNLLTVGSFLPDIALTRIIGWEDLHNKETISKFQTTIQKTKPKFRDLGAGINYHFLLDEVTHKGYKNGTGYAYQCITPELVKLVSQAFYINDECTAKTVAHNIIEIAVDSFVVKENPELLKHIKDAVQSVDINQIGELLSSFFNIKDQKTTSTLTSFFSLMTKYDTRSVDDCIGLCKEVNKLLFNKSLNDNKAKRSLLLARELVKDSYHEFLNFSIPR